MKRNRLLILLFLGISSFSQAQLKSYEDSLRFYFKKYVAEHEVVTGTDRQYLQFFPVQESYRVLAEFNRTENSPWFKLETTGAIQKNYRVFGTARFLLRDTIVVVNIYQSQQLMDSPEYQDYLFLTFTDPTCGHDTYEGGRYIDLRLKDISGDHIVIDFNKAYNPYCAYTSGYNCPIPPRENHIRVAIRAGEMKYGKKH